MSLTPPKYLANRFEILDRIDYDPSNSTYLARDRAIRSELGSLQVKVAVKVIDINKISPLLVTREIEKLQNIHSENLQNVYELLQEDTRLILSLEPLKGNTLANISKGQVLDSHTVTRILLGLAKGLQTLHNNSVVHGMLKPETIYVDGEGTPKIDLSARSLSGKNSAIDDLAALVDIGLQLKNHRLLIPTTKILRYTKKFWRVEIEHSPELCKILATSGKKIERLVKYFDKQNRNEGQLNRERTLALRLNTKLIAKLSAHLAELESQDRHDIQWIRYVFSGNALVLVYLTLFLTLTISALILL